jgi:hypothetical protein
MLVPLPTPPLLPTSPFPLPALVEAAVVAAIFIRSAPLLPTGGRWLGSNPNDERGTVSNGLATGEGGTARDKVPGMMGDGDWGVNGTPGIKAPLGVPTPDELGVIGVNGVLGGDIEIGCSDA